MGTSATASTVDPDTERGSVDEVETGALREVDAAT
jgi:hypothetical protein